MQQTTIRDLSTAIEETISHVIHNATVLYPLYSLRHSHLISISHGSALILLCTSFSRQSNPNHRFTNFLAFDFNGEYTRFKFCAASTAICIDWSTPFLQSERDASGLPTKRPSRTNISTMRVGCHARCDMEVCSVPST